MNSSESRDSYQLPLLIIFFALIVGLLIIGDSNTRYITLAVLLLFLAFYASVFVHELGHLITGLRLGYRLKIFAVGMLQVYPEEDQLRIGWRRLAWQPANMIGFTLFEVDFTDFQRRMTWLVAAGPLANALLMLVSGVLSLGTNGFPSYALYLSNPFAWILSEFNSLLFWVSLLLLIMSLYPAEWASTDGHKLARLLRGSAILERFKAQMQVASAVLQGIRPRDWSLAWVDALLALKDESVDTVTAHTSAYRWALDHGDEEQAETYLTTAVMLRNKVSPAERTNLLVEAAYVEMRYHANANNAREWIERLGAEQKRAQPILRLRLACAANLILRRYAQAREIAQQSINTMDRLGANDGLSIMERDLFRDIIHLANLADEMQAKRGAEADTESSSPTE